MFEKIIGYEAIKSELTKFCDIIINTDYYKSLGISIPKGVILFGDPGLGKTTFATSIIEACNRPSFILRKNADTKQFIDNIISTFNSAKKSAPSIVVLDDMDKYGNGEQFAQEYTSLQGILDDYRQYDIFVIATVNDLFKLPPSLYRSGRFDQIISIPNPAKEESHSITNHYIDSKAINIDPSANRETIAKILEGCSCAQIEVIINTAARYAAYERRQCITMDDIINSVLSIRDNISIGPDNRSFEDKYRKAIYEAGKLVMQVLLNPQDISFATIRERTINFINTDNSVKNKYLEHYDKYLPTSKTLPEESIANMCILLGGKTCYEMKFGRPEFYSGIEISIVNEIIEFYLDLVDDYPSVLNNNNGGFIDINDNSFENISKIHKSNASRKESIWRSVVDRDMQLLSINWSLVEQIAQLLVNKLTVTADDIKYLLAQRNSYNSLPCFNTLYQQ